MPGDGVPAGLAIHATAVAIERRGLLICGRSGAGKSRLAAALVAASSPRRRILLVGDDRVLLFRTGKGLEVRPHPRVAGFIERRGLGIVAMAWCERVAVDGVALLGEDAAPCALARQNLPTLRLVAVDGNRCTDAVLAWWQDSHVEAARSRSDDARGGRGDKDWNW